MLYAYFKHPMSMVAKCQVQTHQAHLCDKIEHRSAKAKKQVGGAVAILWLKPPSHHIAHTSRPGWYFPCLIFLQIKRHNKIPLYRKGCVCPCPTLDQAPTIILTPAPKLLFIKRESNSDIDWKNHPAKRSQNQEKTQKLRKDVWL